jgi:hypothetical protein
VSTVFLRRGDTSRESILMFVSLSYTERERVRRGLERERKRVALLREYVCTLCLIERELGVKIRKTLHYPNIAIEFFIQLIKKRLSKTLLVQTKNFKMPKLQQKQQKTSNNGASNKGTKRSHPAKIAPTSKDKSKKVSSLPVIICTYVLYRDYVRLRTCYTYVDIRVIRIVYVYVAMFY